MDYRRQTLGFLASLTLIAFASACAPKAAPQTDLSPEVLKWIKPGTDIVQSLSVNNAECLTEAASNDPNVYLGRAAFRSPFLLGGQATRQGLTCQACHMQGQRTSNFFIEGLSEEPGTADVTNFHFSEDLGDDVFNPTRIPSLADGVRGVSYDPESRELEKLVTRLITNEFDGDTPHPDVFAGLLSYLRALDVNFCGAKDAEGPKLEGRDLLDYHLKSLTQTFDLIMTANYAAEPKQFMVASLRYELGNIYRHYPNSKSLQSDLEALGRVLSAREGGVSEVKLLEARALWGELKPNLAKDYSKSLFHPPAIQKWLEKRGRK